jgi:hypothetical protein
MTIVTGRVVGNTVVLDEELPDGTEVEVHTADGLWLDSDTTQELYTAVVEADKKGEFVAADVVLEGLRRDMTR